MREWATRLAARQPLAIILEDLHWADATSLALLETMLETTEAAPILLGLVFRPDRDHGSWRVNDVARQRYPHRHTEMTLDPLGPANTAQLVTNLLMIPDLPAEVRDAILQRAEGNPFFIEEVIRSLNLEPFRTQALAQLGRSRDIAREDRDDPSFPDPSGRHDLFGNLTWNEVPERLPAVGGDKLQRDTALTTEACIRRVVVRTDGTSHGRAPLHYGGSKREVCSP